MGIGWCNRIRKRRTVDRPQGVVASPAMLPDGQTVLFTKRPSVSWEEAHVDSIHIATKERKTLLTNAADARYSSTGHLVFIRNAALLAVAFDAARAEISGSPVPLVAGVMQATMGDRARGQPVAHCLALGFKPPRTRPRPRPRRRAAAPRRRPWCGRGGLYRRTPRPSDRRRRSSPWAHR